MFMENQSKVAKQPYLAQILFKVVLLEMLYSIIKSNKKFFKN
jgi:hypothetical protein